MSVEAERGRGQSSILILAKALSHYNALLAADQLKYSAPTLKLHNLLLHSHLLSFDQECEKLRIQTERALATLQRDARRANGEPDIVIPDSASVTPVPANEISTETENNVIPPNLPIPPTSLSLLDPTIPQLLPAEPITLDFSNLIPSTANQSNVGEDLVIGEAGQVGMDTGADIMLDGMMGDGELEALLNSLGS